MAEFPAFPLYIDALHTDCDHLSHAEFGLYLRLLFQMWRSPSGDGTIPNDDKWLGRRLKMTDEAVSSDLRPLIKEFCQVRGSRLTQKRLQRELIRCLGYRRRQSERAKVRWDKDKPISRGSASPAMQPISKSSTLTSNEYVAEAEVGKREEETAPSPTDGAPRPTPANGHDAAESALAPSPALLNSRLMRKARHA